ncbi:unnamed protein product, partial [Effrenium voratum]
QAINGRRAMESKGAGPSLQEAIRRALLRCAGDFGSRGAERELRSLLATHGAPEALAFAAKELALADQLCSVGDLLSVLRACDSACLAPELAALVAEELLGFEEVPPRLQELVRQMLDLGWIQVVGLVAVVEELVAAWVKKDVKGLPPCLSLLECAPVPRQLPQALARAPQLSRLLVDCHVAVQNSFPALAQAATPLLLAPMKPSKPRAAPVEGSGVEEADSEGSTPPSRLSSKVAFEAVEDLPTDGSSPEGLLPYALLPTVLPGSPQHLGLLLAGAGGMLEEWDLDVGLRLDRLSVVEETRADVVSLAAPSSATHEVLVAAVNCPDDAGLALLRREADVWQLESPWPCTTTGWRHLARVSHGNFLQCSQSVMALGQTSAIGTHEVGVYDVALEPRPLTACLGHWDFVTDVCTISTQTFGSVSLDGMLLLWDFRQGLTPSAKAGFGATAPKALCSLAACRDLLLCGGLQGELCLFDLRRLAEPLARPPAASGAVVRLRLWPSTAQTLVAAVACAKDGLCSLTVGADCGTGILQPALFQPALKEPRLCYDVAAGPAAWHSEPGPGSAVFACSDGGVTRFRAVQRAEQRKKGVAASSKAEVE